MDKLLSNPEHILCELVKDDFKLAKEIWGDGVLLDDDDFASAMFDGRDVYQFDDGFSTLRRWQYHLQQLIISPDPVAYIQENTKGGE